MTLNVANALRIGQFANAAYAPKATPNTYAVPNGYQLVQEIYGNDLATDIGGLKAIVPFGFIARSPEPANDFVVAIRGTEGIWEWLQDARFLRIICPFAAGAGTTEDGFTDGYRSLTVGSAAGAKVIDELQKLLSNHQPATLTITGHSLGAALATLLALDVAENSSIKNVSAITFASPLVGDAQFARTYNVKVPNTWRIANDVDIVPKLPPPVWGFDHVDRLFSVNSFGKASILPPCTHSLNTYLYLLDQINGGTTYHLDPACK